MSLDTPATSGKNPARQIAVYFGAIADTLDWQQPEWLALNARLQACGTPVRELTLQQVYAAITATRAEVQA